MIIDSHNFKSYKVAPPQEEGILGIKIVSRDDTKLGTEVHVIKQGNEQLTIDYLDDNGIPMIIVIFKDGTIQHYLNREERSVPCKRKYENIADPFTEDEIDHLIEQKYQLGDR